MAPKHPTNEWSAIAEALFEIRDTWVLLSLELKDHLADAPSPLRNEVTKLVDTQVARIRNGELGTFE